MDPPPIEKQRFGRTADGQSVDGYVLRNRQGMRAKLITYGATLVELDVPDRHGRPADVVLGFDRLEQYETQSPYFGCIVGRVAFRIANATFTLDGKTYRLTRNSGRHHLHGGARGLSKVVWEAEPFLAADGPAVRFSHTSPDGAEGYPGNLSVTVVYRLTHAGQLRIDYRATTDRPTPVNLTHHSYFNLAGAGSGDVLNHVLWINAQRYTPMSEELTPTGEIAPVRGTPFDFTAPTPIGARIDQAGGYDVSYLLPDRRGALSRVASVREPVSGRMMEVWTTAPAIVLYTGNYLDGTLVGKGESRYPRFGGLCLETGHLPDAVHHANFPSIILRPGQTYRQTCVYGFSPSNP